MYDEEWREMPPGYYADPKIKADYWNRREEIERRNRLVNEELRKLGVENPDEADWEDLAEAEARAKKREEW